MKTVFLPIYLLQAAPELLELAVDQFGFCLVQRSPLYEIISSIDDRDILEQLINFQRVFPSSHQLTKQLLCYTLFNQSALCSWNLKMLNCNEIRNWCLSPNQNHNSQNQNTRQNTPIWSKHYPQQYTRTLVYKTHSELLF